VPRLPSLGLAIGAAVVTYKVARRIPTVDQLQASSSP
jgi:hypothetical protein